MDARSLLLDRVPGLGRFRGDIMGGLVSAGVAIPLAMGYGMFGFVVLGNDYFLDGARAGLLTAVVVGIACVVLGDKSANVYAPRVITTFFIGILLYGLVNSQAPVLKSGGLGLILAVLFSIMLLAGVFQAVFGLTRLGTVIRFIPQPVMSGFQNAAALLLLLVQLGNLFGFDKSITFVQALKDVQHARPLSLLIAGLTIVAMLQARRWLPKVPALLAGLAAGTLLYYPPRPGGARQPSRADDRQRALQPRQGSEPAAVRRARQSAGRPGAVADDRRRRAGARHHRLDRRPALQQAPCAARRAKSRRRPAAGAARDCERALRHARRHHRRAEHRAEPGQQGCRRAHAGLRAGERLRGARDPAGAVPRPQLPALRCPVRGDCGDRDPALRSLDHAPCPARGIAPRQAARRCSIWCWSSRSPSSPSPSISCSRCSPASRSPRCSSSCA